ncbi:anthrone oxygenase family protein [Arthrobacter sp. MDT2-16]
MIQVATVVGAGLLGGVYAAFSAMVIPALRRLDDEGATAAMIQINRKAERGPFIVMFGVAALAATGSAITAAPRGNTIELVIAGASLASTIVTMTVNVPLNRRLERDGSTFWNVYSHHWTTANTVRATLAATAVLTAATHWSPT